MGWYSANIRVTGRRSAHNSLQDELDIAKWNYLKRRIESLLNNPDLESIGPFEVEVNTD